MKKEIVYWTVVMLLSNVILFTTCALPWYAVISISNWWALLAVPTTAGGGFVLSWILQDLWFAVDDWLG